MTWKLNKRKITADTERLGAEDDDQLKKILQRVECRERPRVSQDSRIIF